KNSKFEDTNSFIGVAYIFEDDEWIDELYSYYQKEKITPIIDAIYTKEEYEKAQWYSILSKFRFEYPQPEDDSAYKGITYNNSKFCSSCGCGLVQKDSFRIVKAPKWGKRHFLMLNWVEDELFISSFAKDLLVRNSISGLRFLDVINHKKNIPFDDIYQIYIENELEPGLLELKQSVKEVRNCSICGKAKYIYSGKGLTFRKEIFSNINSDIVRTHESFGDGHICARKIIISKKLYQLIKNSNLGKDLDFEPIVLA
ncbi:hypothetical protein, partial [Ruminiclostridium josui]